MSHYFTTMDLCRKCTLIEDGAVRHEIKSVSSSFLWFPVNLQHLMLERKTAKQADEKIKNKKGNLKHLESPGDLTKAGQRKEIPDSIQAGEQSTCGGREHDVGGEDAAVLLKNHFNGVLHCKLSSTWVEIQQMKDISPLTQQMLQSRANLI